MFWRTMVVCAAVNVAALAHAPATPLLEETGTQLRMPVANAGGNQFFHRQAGLLVLFVFKNLPGGGIGKTDIALLVDGENAGGRCFQNILQIGGVLRSEERRVGKECRSRWA